MFKHLLLLVGVILSLQGYSQLGKPLNYNSDKRPGHYVMAGAQVITSAGEESKQMWIEVKDGVIHNLHSEDPKLEISYIPCFDQTIIPSFIDLDAEIGINTKAMKNREMRGPRHWNPAVHPELRAADYVKLNSDDNKTYRSQGFGLVASRYNDGIFQGTAVLTDLDDQWNNKSVVESDVLQGMSFSKGNSKEAYPGSLMGSIALIRQTLYDTDWYSANKRRGRVPYDPALEALNRNRKKPILFTVSDPTDIERVQDIADEFKLSPIISVGMEAYQEIPSFTDEQKLIIRLNEVKGYDIEDPLVENLLSQEKLMHWEYAPYNAALLDANGIDFVLSAKDKQQGFLQLVKQAVEYGLSADEALKALTIYPAQWLGIDQEFGKIVKGKPANFLVTSGDLFTSKFQILTNVINGNPYVIEDPMLSMSGKFQFDYNKASYFADFSNGKIENIIQGKDTLNTKGAYQFNGKKITLSIVDKDNQVLWFRGSGVFDKTKFTVVVKNGFGDYSNISFERISDLTEEEQQQKDSDIPSIEELDIPYPFSSFGITEQLLSSIDNSERLLTAVPILIQNATIWTNTEKGVIQGGVYLKDGKVISVFENGQMPNVADNTIIYNFQGAHISAGIIDEHSHIAISRGVNEATQNITSEVRIGDVVDHRDVNIYRQLSGGVIASQLLHGSANPVGGQSALIKLNWGESANGLNINNTDGFIKFALGENVKQANWGDNYRTRFPQTRMGVEQVYYDGFKRAKYYAEEKKKYKRNPLVYRKPRVDLELEALQEILESKRFISCHSYIQSEINMLMHVADSMGFKVNTFTHILEGYKLADKMKAHGAAGSTFSDWWAYKFEVNDAIPYNAAMMTKAGVLSAINSDDAEMGRRLNQEAAKAIKYGALSEEEALKLVTLNPAKMLHLDDQLGTVEAGKSASIVVWSDHPLSIYAKAELTIIDGVVRYERSLDELRTQHEKAERARLMSKLLKYKQSGGEMQEVKPEDNSYYHCH